MPLTNNLEILILLAVNPPAISTLLPIVIFPVSLFYEIWAVPSLEVPKCQLEFSKTTAP